MAGIAGLAGGQAGWPSLSAIQQNLFANIDSSRDGQISPDELLAFGQNLPGSLTGSIGGAASSASSLTQVDTDGDGSPSPNELTAFGNKLSTSNNSSLLQAQEDTNDAGRAHHRHHGNAGQSTGPANLLAQLDSDPVSPQAATQFGAGTAASSYANTNAATQSGLGQLLQFVDKLIG